jgi:hypothetical protein
MADLNEIKWTVKERLWLIYDIISFEHLNNVKKKKKKNFLN